MVDEDAEYCFMDMAENLIRVKDDQLHTLTLENAVWEPDSVSIATAYGLSIEGYEKELGETVNRQLDMKNRPLIVMSYRKPHNDNRSTGEKTHPSR